MSLNANFSAQRDSNGQAVFDQQIVTQIALNAGLTGVSKVTAALPRYVFVASTLASSGLVTSALGQRTHFASVLSSQGIVTARTWQNSVLSVQLKSEGSLTASFRNFTNVSVNLLGRSTINATLVSSAPQYDYISATLISAGSVNASLQAGLASNIPITSRLSAISALSDNGQIVRYRGDTYADLFYVRDEVTGEPIDVSGSLLLMTLSKDKEGNEMAYQMYGVTEPETDGAIYFVPTENQSDRVGFFYYDVQMRDVSNIVRTLASGSYVYKHDITKN